MDAIERDALLAALKTLRGEFPASDEKTDANVDPQRQAKIEGYTQALRELLARASPTLKLGETPE